MRKIYAKAGIIEAFTTEHATIAENIKKLAYAIRDLELPMLLPGIKVNTSPDDHMPLEQMQFMRFDGKQWEGFGEILTAN